METLSKRLIVPSFKLLLGLTAWEAAIVMRQIKINIGSDWNHAVGIKFWQACITNCFT